MDEGRQVDLALRPEFLGLSIEQRLRKALNREAEANRLWRIVDMEKTTWQDLLDGLHGRTDVRMHVGEDKGQLWILVFGDTVRVRPVDDLPLQCIRLVERR